jgi:RNA polymerase sigma-70 factor (ECF subfamily)
LPQDDRRRRFELLALPHLDAAYNLARWLAGNTTDAEDVVQDAYLRAYRYFDTFQGGNFRVWLLTIVRNTFVTWVKENRSGRMVFTPDAPVADNAESEETMWGSRPRDPESLLLESVDSQTLGRLMEQLNQRCRRERVISGTNWDVAGQIIPRNSNEIYPPSSLDIPARIWEKYGRDNRR